MADVNFQGRSALILGCGYVGVAVGRALTDAGATVDALTRNAERADEAEQFARNVIRCELDTADWHNQVATQYDFVLNCVSSAGNGMEGYRKSYIGGMGSIIDWAQNAEVGTYAYTSATSVYPHSDGRIVTEEDVPEDLTANGDVLREAEELIENAPAGCWERAFILRLGAIYGPTRHHLLDALKRGTTTFPGEGGFYLNYIHLDDIVSAVLASFATTSAPAGAYNVVDGDYPTKAAVVEWLAEQIGAPKPVFDPTMQARRGPMRTNAQGSLPNRRVSNEKLRRELGWTPKYPDFKAGYASLL
ncbi:NAD-dependent epimerase/dehydratase family protein [Cerasicoccus fimbriatus]|uniref:NAD-dependent epimerase/dehydratase family protein n=1 Tax=Cerasicoccus fimbriatus TaxID=3014554 RepID=UPI0022B5CD76|nr:NAD-dependent epimerase/dehydratase family protein [Cerasicoccus sp. TK19100]